MLRHIALIVTIALLSVQSPPASAEIYKWVDEDGKLHMSDKPPRKGKAEKIEIKTYTYAAPPVSTTTLPASTRKAAKRGKQKVTMYSTTWCGVCKKAKSYFRKNGIPFKEYDVEKSAKGKRDFKKLGGKGVPVILVGSLRMNGFSAGGFERMYRGE